MTLRLRMKEFVEQLPPGVGRLAARVPFSVRLGPGYSWAVKRIRQFEEKSTDERMSLVEGWLKDVVRAAWREVPFYRKHYESRDFHPDHFRSMQDWGRVPPVSRADLQGLPLADRTISGEHGYLLNTGGTAGTPLEFRVDSGAWAREWAHLHYIWKGRGYKTSQLNVTLRGKHFEGTRAIRYNAVHNEFMVNTSRPLEEVADALESLPPTTVIRWLHGYPSFIAELADLVEARGGPLQERLRTGLFGILLASEYPAPVYRDPIERVFSTNTVSWYGHSEQAILARETARGAYASLPTYGYAETLEGDDGDDGERLLCSSFFNTVHPFIRYDTGDLVETISQTGGTLCFRIKRGRIGDFVLDREGRKLSLTAMFFGRHHRAFGRLKHLQVSQGRPGQMTLLVTPCDWVEDTSSLRSDFDLDDLQLDWSIRVLDEPVRTSAGKVRMLVAPEALDPERCS